MFNGFDIKLTEERRLKVYKQIEENCFCDFGFYTMTAIASLIVALGLFINNIAVVIGGMLLAPLFNHMLGISISIVRGNIKKFKFHLLTLLYAIVLAIFLTYILFLILPNNHKVPDEILNRGNANILHFAIALFSGIAAATAMALPRISASIIGILIASAILPPLATISYALSLGDINLLGGAFLLFLTNFITIIFFAAITFYFFGFKPPKTKTAKEFIKKDLYWSIALLILILIPLSYSFIKANQENYNEKKIIEIVKNNISNVQVSDISKISIYKQNENYIIDLIICIDQKISYETKKEIENQIIKALNLNAKVRLTIIETIKL